MPLVSMSDLMQEAIRGKYALGYFEAWDTYSVEAVLEAAEEERSPVILGFGGMMLSQEWLDNGGIELLGTIGRAIAERSKVSVSLLLNELQTLEQALRGMDAGINAVMVDTSDWAWEKAVETVSQLACIAHRRGVTVEAELGHLPDATATGIDDSTSHLTDPKQAAEFIASTGADCLAVSIGNVHLLTAHDAPVDLDRLEEIHQTVEVPLVIHGGTSFPAAAVPAAIELGVAKFNVGTVLKKQFLEGVRSQLKTALNSADVHSVLGSHKDADFLEAAKTSMKETVKSLMRVYGSSSRAAKSGAGRG